ncbi:ClpX C4-type zinc finger protein [Arthrobacter castelli]|uniref:ClpX C4-type zinc finger protein n=1 Tax=Arthrobacter castelli TaxID=271431 RepID=UPI00056ADC4F|nr:ClpX C4-type zinc finger protein [Arthrobacter castelli]
MAIEETGPHPSFCSFCAKPRSSTSRLVAGPGVAICGSCVERAARVLDDSVGAPEDFESGNGRESMTDEQLLSHLPQVADVGGQVEAALSAWVSIARDRGISWARIGGSLGMTRQSAWERFRSRPGPLASE